MKINIKAYVKSLLSLNCMTMKELSEKLTEKTGKKYTSDSLSAKLKRETFSLKEAYLMAEILGYEIEFKKK